MHKSCGTCRHWHEFNDSPGHPIGTCRVRAPVRGNGCLDDLGLTDPIDRLAVCLWLSTVDQHLCAKHTWKCQTETRDCRGPVTSTTLGDEQDGTVYCMEHCHEKRRRPARVA